MMPYQSDISVLFFWASMNSDTREIMDTKQVGKYIRRSVGAVRNLCMRRQIPYRKVAGRLVFLRSEIDTWVKNAPGVRLEDLK